MTTGAQGRLENEAIVAAGDGLTWNMETLDGLTQAETYGRVLAEEARRRPEIVVCCADLLKSTKLRDFQRAFPRRVFNFGVAEQNLVAVAAGMALEGLHPFVSTFGVFASLRAAEQVRTDVAYQKTRVKIIATHAGVSFGQAGPTHHAIEDLAVMRAIPGMTVIIPADARATAAATAALAGLDAPAYMRLSRGLEPPAYEDGEFTFVLGKANVLREGSALSIIACGVAVQAAREAADDLKEQGVLVRVVDMHTLKPLDREAVVRAARETGGILTVEEHGPNGGLGSAVAEVLAEERLGVPFRRLSLPDAFCQVGYPEDLYAIYGIDADGIRKAAKRLLKGAP